MSHLATTEDSVAEVPVESAQIDAEWNGPGTLSSQESAQIISMAMDDMSEVIDSIQSSHISLTAGAD